MAAILAIFLLGIAVAVLGMLFWQSQQKIQRLTTRFSGILDLEAAVTEAKHKLDKAKSEQQNVTVQAEKQRAQLSKEYEQALGKYNELKKEISLLEEDVESISFGIYKPHFGFETSEEYKHALEKVREEERELISGGRAASCAVQWTVGNSKTDGKRMIKQYVKLLLRAFNGECDAAVANVTWNNVGKMEERVRKSFEAVNQLGSMMQMSVTPEYLKLKLDELRLAHEYDEKKHQEKEEQRRIKAQIREEEKVQRELQRAQEEAERKETEYQKALEKAREEAMKATGAQLEKLTEQIASLQTKVEEAHESKERAVSRAQLTKSGFVYVISNVGSFGENVVKIGMTRRLEPQERIDELGDASVPFDFDIHAMLYSDDAPTLETSLHQLLEDRRVNLVNQRKEFYRDVKLDEIEAFVKQRGLSAQFIKVPEAKEYRETVAMRAAALAKDNKPLESDKFSAALFASASSAS